VNSWIVEVLADHYGISGQLFPLPGEYDLNIRVVTDIGDQYLLKVMSSDCDETLVDLQICALSLLERQPLGVSTQRVHLAHNGQAKVHVIDEQGRKRLCWLITYLPGRLLSDIDTASWTPMMAWQIGQALARVNLALASFEHPTLIRGLKWDLRQAGWIADHLGLIEQPERRAIMATRVAQYREYLQPALEGLPRTNIHGDAHEMNLLFMGHSAPILSGIIDFGDLIHSARVCEPAVAGAYLMMGSGDALGRLEAVVAGYHAVSALSDREIEFIFPLALMRLSISATNAAVEKRANPQDDYITLSEEPAWEALTRFANADQDVIAQRLKVAASKGEAPVAELKANLLRRRRTIAPENLSLSYGNPLHIVRGERHFLFDSSGRRFLDAYNNVPHVGHAHPRVTEAVTRQLKRVNTNSRYLLDVHLDYAERLLALAPETITRVLFVNSASEANELALRLARAFTGAKDMIVLEHGYHGATTGAVDISPYKFEKPGMGGAPDWVQVVRQPDRYRGFLRGKADELTGYLDEVDHAITEIREKRKSLCGFICECLPSVGGQLVLPVGYLSGVYERVRAAGGVAIADDVQTALGRLGDCFWGFEQQAVTPDIVVLGKPLGNGYPLAAVLTTEAIAEAFGKGPEFFSTFGGSSVACAAGLSVLEVLEEEGLQEQARMTGLHLRQGFESLAARHPLIGDVRGLGLFWGLDLVDDREDRRPAIFQANHIKNRLMEEGILTGTDGPHNNVLKIRPPMSFDIKAADQLIGVLDGILAETLSRPR
jgi:4-aminobutyrate aminotransferase-like enzyme/Ser/Thr protein kinase RdoA (MazF antagonist)